MALCHSFKGHSWSYRQCWNGIGKKLKWWDWMKIVFFIVCFHKQQISHKATVLFKLITASLPLSSSFYKKGKFLYWNKKKWFLSSSYISFSECLLYFILYMLLYPRKSHSIELMGLKRLGDDYLYFKHLCSYFDKHKTMSPIKDNSF